MEKTSSQKYNFLLQGTNGRAVLLIHGITGTPSEMRYLGRVLHKAGYTVMCNALPRHCDTLGELKKVTWQEIADKCELDFLSLSKTHQRVFAAGISMGALMSIHLAYKLQGKVAGIGALATTVFYDGWALHKGKIFMQLLWHIPCIRNSMNIREGWPYGLKDEKLRSDIERFYKAASARKFDNQALTFGSPFFPLCNLYQHHQFTKVVTRELGHVTAPIKLIHAKEDDMTSPRNARYIFDRIASKDKEVVILKDSYHMVTIDKEKDKVAGELLSFFNRL